MESVDASAVQDEYCAFTKAIEQLGDRWALLIIRELGMRGPKGFSALVADLPGRISRSVLADRLDRLVSLGLVTRPDRAAGRHAYDLTSVGRGLVPVLDVLRAWSTNWLPDDPEAVRRDPAVLLGWLAERVERRRLPRPAVVLELRLAGGGRSWLVVEDGTDPYGCVTDPLLADDRYVYVDTDVATLLALARGRTSWQGAVADGSARLAGEPRLVQSLPGWFVSTTLAHH